MNALRRIVSLWRPQAGWLAAGIAASLLAVGCGVALMGASGAAIGSAVLAGTVAASVALKLLGIGRVVFRYAERLLTHEATFRALAQLRVWFFRRLAVSAAGGLGFRRAGDVLGRLVGDIEAQDGLYLRILVPLASAVVLLPVLTLIVALHQTLVAAGVGALFAFAAFVLPSLAMRRALRAGDRLAAASGALRVAALDTLTGLREVRAFAAEGRMLAAVQARESRLVKAQRRIAYRAAAAAAGSLLCAQAAILLVLATAEANPAIAVATVFLVIAAFEAIGGLPRAGVLAGHAAAAARRVVQAADAPPPVPDPAEPAAPPRSHRLRFEHVEFRWRPDRAPVFQRMSLDVPAGARIAVLGPSGSGKSTLAALALKVAAPQSGRILLGETDIAALAADAVRARISFLSQATHLFDDTIRANLALARPGADDAALWAALDAAHIGDAVRSLPGGLEAWVGENGARLSGGQGRRLALARALLSDAPILILDEPCAGLDSETERAFLATLNEVAPGRSVVLIVHRLTGVERLDRIYRLSGGHAVAAAA